MFRCDFWNLISHLGITYEGWLEEKVWHMKVELIAEWNGITFEGLIRRNCITFECWSHKIKCITYDYCSQEGGKELLGKKVKKLSSSCFLPLFWTLDLLLRKHLSLLRRKLCEHTRLLLFLLPRTIWGNEALWMTMMVDLLAKFDVCGANSTTT